MKKINSDKFTKNYMRSYTRVFSKNDLKKERKELVDRIEEIDALISEMDKDK